METRDLKWIPKVELHAHLTGCYRISTLERFLQEDGQPPFDFVIPPSKVYRKEVWDDCVGTFWKMSGLAVGERRTILFDQVIEDYADEGALYVEFRIGLKGNTVEEKISHYLQLQAVIRESSKRFPNLMVKLLITVARHSSLEECSQLLQAAVHLFRQPDSLVVGLDFAGNPFSGSWFEIKPLFEQARAAGMKLALHAGERADSQDEWADLVAFKPDRIGHGSFFSDSLLEKVVAAQIPLELCGAVAKRFLCIPVQDLILNRLKRLGHAEHPVVFCADNTWLNCTSPCLEYAMAREDFNLTEEQVVAYARRAIQFAFCSDQEKAILQERFDERVREHVAVYR